MPIERRVEAEARRRPAPRRRPPPAGVHALRRPRAASIVRGRAATATGAPSRSSSGWGWTMTTDEALLEALGDSTAEAVVERAQDVLPRQGRARPARRAAERLRAARADPGAGGRGQRRPMSTASQAATSSSITRLGVQRLAAAMMGADARVGRARPTELSELELSAGRRGHEPDDGRRSRGDELRARQQVEIGTPETRFFATAGGGSRRATRDTPHMTCVGVHRPAASRAGSCSWCRTPSSSG